MKFVNLVDILIRLKYLFNKEHINGDKFIEETINLAVDAEPVRRGHWIEEAHEEAGGIYHYLRCSHCGEYTPCDSRTPYCPWCGAWLTKEVEKDE